MDCVAAPQGSTVSMKQCIVFWVHYTVPMKIESTPLLNLSSLTEMNGCENLLWPLAFPSRLYSTRIDTQSYRVQMY